MADTEEPVLDPLRDGPPPDPEAYDDECDPKTGTAFRVTLPRFWGARYPVIVSQWKRFYVSCALDFATGQRVRQRLVRLNEPGEGPHVALHPASVADPDTRPVAYISWYDAMAYGMWLTAAWRAMAVPAGARLPAAVAAVRARTHVVTLPSEAEWEKLARGKTRHIRPWGNELTPQHANYYWGSNSAEEWLGRTSAVGAFRAGRSPSAPGGSRNRRSAEDLLGNLLEWTRSNRGRDWHVQHWSYPYEPDYSGVSREDIGADAATLRVVRGGCVYSNSGSVRTGDRNGYCPARRDDFFGFRVVVSPFALDTLIADP